MRKVLHIGDEMEIKEEDLYLAKLLEKNAIKQDEFEDIEYKPEINAFCSKYLSAIFIDNINFGWSVWQAKATPEGFVLVEVQEFESLKSDNKHFTESCIDWTDRAYKQQAKVEFIKNEVERFKQSGTDLDLERFLDNLIEFSTFKHDEEFEGFVLVPVKEIKTWFLDESENIYREDPDWLCDIPIGEVVEVEHRVSYELEQDPVFAAIQWDEINGDVGNYETFDTKEEAEKVAEHCKAMIEAQEQSHD